MSSRVIGLVAVEPGGFTTLPLASKENLSKGSALSDSGEVEKDLEESKTEIIQGTWRRWWSLGAGRHDDGRRGFSSDKEEI